MRQDNIHKGRDLRYEDAVNDYPVEIHYYCFVLLRNLTKPIPIMSKRKHEKALSRSGMLVITFFAR
jgi:hypothetical protein